MLRSPTAGTKTPAPQPFFVLALLHHLIILSIRPNRLTSVHGTSFRHIKCDVVPDVSYSILIFQSKHTKSLVSFVINGSQASMPGTSFPSISHTGALAIFSFSSPHSCRSSQATIVDSHTYRDLST